MALVIKNIKGRPYWYYQESQRVLGKVQTPGKYLCPVYPKRKKGLTLGIILGGLLQASAQSFAPKHEKKERQARARAPDKRSREAQFAHERQQRQETIDTAKAHSPAGQSNQSAVSPFPEMYKHESGYYASHGQAVESAKLHAENLYAAASNPNPSPLASPRDELLAQAAKFDTQAMVLGAAAPSAPDVSSQSQDAPASVGDAQGTGGKT
jgi:hypothetical protein